MDIKDVENLANLARIELSQNEKEEILSDMKGILDYVQVIEGVEIPKDKSSQIGDHEIYNVYREDKTELREFSRELILGQFPASEDGFLKVKKIL